MTPHPSVTARMRDRVTAAAPRIEPLRRISASPAGARIAVGNAVYGADGRWLGRVTEVNAGYLVVGQSRVLASDYFVPTCAVGHAGGGRAELTVTVAEALASGWDRGQAGGA